MFKKMLMDEYEPGEIVADKVNRRVDLKWIKRDSNPIWVRGIDARGDAPIWFGAALERLEPILPIGRRQQFGLVNIPIRPLPVSGFDDEMAVVADDRYYLLPNTPWADELAEAYRNSDRRGLSATFLSTVLLASLMVMAPSSRSPVEFFEERVVPVLRRSAGLEDEQLAAILEKGRSAGGKVLDVHAWQRGADPSAY